MICLWNHWFRLTYFRINLLELCYYYYNFFFRFEKRSFPMFAKNLAGRKNKQNTCAIRIVRIRKKKEVEHFQLFPDSLDVFRNETFLTTETESLRSICVLSLFFRHQLIEISSVHYFEAYVTHSFFLRHSSLAIN